MNLTQISWASLVPLLIMLGGGVCATLFEAFIPRKIRRPWQIIFALLVVLSSFIALIWRWGLVPEREITPLSVVQTSGGFTGVSFVEDNFSLLGQGTILLVAFLALLVITDRTQTRESAFAASAATTPGSVKEREYTLARYEQSEIFPLTLFATGGMMAFTAAFDLLSVFIALEVLSLPLYVLSATARRRRLLSQEAALKYFLLGAFSSAIYLMGAAFVYGATGSLSFSEIATHTIITGKFPLQMIPILTIGAVMVTIGLLFKISAVPFHAWTPDVYQGAPTPITGFMAAATKAAAFIVLIRVYTYIAGAVEENMHIFLWIVIIATILTGTLSGLVQRNIKRLLAYSSIAHAGFILIAISTIKMLTVNQQTYITANSSILFYLIAYGVATVGAFGIITLVRVKDESGNILGEATDISAWAGLGKRSPLSAFAMTVFLLSFAGIPLTAGFIGKFEVFRAGIMGGSNALVIIAILASVATAFFYFRIIQLMFFQEPAEGVTVVESEGFTVCAIVIAVILTIVLGVFPNSVLALIQGTFA